MHVPNFQKKYKTAWRAIMKLAYGVHIEKDNIKTRKINNTDMVYDF